MKKKKILTRYSVNEAEHSICSFNKTIEDVKLNIKEYLMTYWKFHVQDDNLIILSVKECDENTTSTFSEDMRKLKGGLI